MESGVIDGRAVTSHRASQLASDGLGDRLNLDLEI